MNPSILLLETEGESLKKLQHSAVLEALHADISYQQNETQALSVISKQKNHVGVVVVRFAENFDTNADFFMKFNQLKSSFVTVLLLTDEYSKIDINEIKYAHQILALSCGEDELIEVITRGIQVSNEIHGNPKLAKLLSNLDFLPSPPAVYFELQNYLNSLHCNTDGLTKIISRDQALAARILRVTNSGFYASPHSVVELHQAITLLGTEVLLGLVLTTHLFNSLPLLGVNLDNLWKHTVGVSLMAKYIARDLEMDVQAVEISSISGLLHDLGIVIFICNYPTEYQAMLRRTEGKEVALIEAEQDFFGVDHAQLGRLVLLLWGLPEMVTEAVKNHHNYALFMLDKASPVSVVMIAEWMVNRSLTVDGETENEMLDKIPFECTIEQFENWRNALLEIQEQSRV